MPKKPFPLPDESTLAEIVLKALSQQNQPKTARDLQKLLTGPFKLPEDRLTALLTGLTAGGKISEWPAKGKGKPRFWNELPAPFIAQKIIDHLAEKPLTLLELKRSLTKPLFGIPKSHMDQGIQMLLVKSRLLLHPKMGSVKAKLGLRPPDPKPYLQKVQGELEKVVKMLAPSRVSRDEINKALRDLLGPATGPADLPEEGNLEGQILSKMVEIEPQASAGAVVSLKRLRKSLNWEKEIFDRTMIDLAQKRKVVLHEHSFPQGLSEEERGCLVDDRQSHWYVGAVLKDK